MSADTVNPLGRILIVDEHPVDRIRLQTLLTEAGYAVDTAIDSTHAAELALLHDYGLVLASRRPFRLTDRLAFIAITEIDAEADVLAIVGERIGRPDKRVPPMIDEDRLERLRGEMPADLFSSVLRHFLQGGRERLARIAGLLDQGDLGRLAREAHDLKGISATFGAPKLKDLAGVLERTARASDIVAARALLPELEVLAEQTWACFDRELLGKDNGSHPSTSSGGAD